MTTINKPTVQQEYPHKQKQETRPGLARPSQQRKDSTRKVRPPLVYVSVSDESRLLRAYPKLATLLGVPNYAIMEKPLSHFILNEDLDAYSRHLIQLLSTGEPQKVDLRILKGDGTNHWFHFAMFPALNEDGNPVCSIVLSDLTSRNQTQAPLVQTRELLNRIIDDSPNAMWISDESGTLIHMNQACRDALKMSNDEVVGKYNILSDNILEAQGLMPLVKSAFEHGIKVRFVTAYDTGALETLSLAQSTRVDLDVSISPFVNPDGKVTNTIIQYLDITERKRVEKALRHSHQFLRSTLNALESHVAILDETGTIIFVNRPWREFAESNGAVLEKTLEGANYLNICDAATGDNAEGASEFSKGIRAVLQGTQDKFVWEYACHSPTDQRWFIGRVTRFADDGAVRLVIAHDNITERKRAEDAIVAAALRYQTLLQTKSDGIHVIDVHGNIVETNDTFCTMLGYTREEMMGLNVADFDAQWSGEELKGRVRYFITTPGVFETQHRRKDGSVFEVEISAVGVMLEGRDYCYSAARDITDRKRIQKDKQQLEDRNRQLQKAESLGRMAGAVAHHFNNKLMGVTGNLELTLEDLTAETDGFERVSTALKAASEASELSGLMLTYLGKSHQEQKPEDLSEICRRNLTLLLPFLPKRAKLQSNLSQPGLFIRANESQIQHLIVNTVMNAAESSDSNACRILLTVKQSNATDISAVNRFPLDAQINHNNYACLEVSDTGCGIPSTDIEKLFDPFFSTKFTGRGMGLAAVLGIARLHGGIITVDSEPGRGSVFRFFFPMLEEEEIPQRTEVVHQVKEFSGHGTVLIVDDEDMLRNVTTRLVEQLGFEVLTAKDGAEAVDLFLEHQREIRCVLSDLFMPRMNGWETLEALRKIAPDLPFIIASGHNKETVMEGEHPELPQAYLTKPFRRESLCEAFLQALPREKADS